jgi:hypothetical protein
MKFEIEHECYRLQSGEWVAQFNLNHVAGATLHSQQCFDPRIDLSFATEFATEEEAKQRNRTLALNWRNANCPDAELFERRAEQN